MQRTNSENYLKRKQFFNSLLTIYGRLTVLEALQTEEVEAIKLHLAKSNKDAAILNDIIALAKAKGAEIVEHDKAALSRISKNAKQDQGVALDIKPKGFSEFDSKTSFSAKDSDGSEYIALDCVTNPQNLGMIIRSVCASPVKALIIPRKGCAKLDALVIKASAGTLFRTQIIRCEKLEDVLIAANAAKLDVIGLDLAANSKISEIGESSSPRIFVLGNESEGISKKTQALCNKRVRIPMHNQVESLNVAVTASLIALRNQI